MQVISVNRGEKRTVKWRLRNVETGIFKYQVDEIELGSTDVVADSVVDRKYHGGVDKACYLFSANAYEKWKPLYPNLDWSWGMFGENITVEGLDESDIFIGSTYQLGSAVVEVSEPRQPCFKLGIRLGTQKVLKQFIAFENSGVYLRVLQPGKVKVGDSMKLITKGSNYSIKDVFQLLYKRHNKPEIASGVIATPKLAQSAQKDLRKIYSQV